MLSQPAAKAASETGDIQPQLWFDLNKSYSPTSRFEIYGDAGVRKELDTD